MSVADSIDYLRSVELELESLEDKQRALRQQMVTSKKEIIGELDRQMVMGLYRMGFDIQHYDVDGQVWHLIPVIRVGTMVEKHPRPMIQVSRWDGHLIAPKLIDAPILDRLTLDKHPGHYDLDAWMLTDRHGHQIHTAHSYEGWHSAPHWYEDGWIDLKSPEHAIRDFMKRKRKGY